MDISKQSEKHEEALMTIAQSIRQDGMKEGMQQGIQQGMERGIEKGMQKGILEGEKQASMKIARQMLEDGMDRQAVMKFTGLTEKDLSQLFVS